MADISGPYVVFEITGGSPSITFDMFRRVGIDGDPVQVANDVPFLGSPGGTAVWYDVTAPIGVELFYQAFTSTGDSTALLGPFTLPALGKVWLTDPLRPWADIEMDNCPVDSTGHRPVPGCEDPDPVFVAGGFTGSLDHREDVSLIPILNAERPADVWARRKYADGGYRFFSRTLDAIDRVYDLFTAGGPLMLRVPDVYGWHDQFIQPGTLEMTHVSRDQRRPERMWDFPFTVVDQPFGPIQGTDCNNWCEVKESFPTFAELTAYPGTWLDLMNGDVLCSSTPPGEDGFGLGPFGGGPFGDGG